MAIKAVVQKIIPDGKHGHFFVATSDQIPDGSITCSLEPTVWTEGAYPEEGEVVFLDELRQKRAGWRAKKGRFWNPSDEQNQQIERRKQMSTAAQNTFKSFLVEGGYDGKNIFRVIEVTGDISREKIERLLEGLPISFQLRKEPSLSADDLNDPIEVYVNNAVISIYPPRHRVIVCTTLDSWNSADVVSKMHVDNVMDTITSGYGQVRSCVHFDPVILGIEGWPQSVAGSEVEVDIHVYPRGKGDEPELKALTFGKSDVRKLLDLIAGGERGLTVEQLKEWRDLIMYAVWSMRSCYENPDVAEDYPVRVYFKPCWEAIETARDDSQLIEALEKLRGRIESE